jgi:hypothetical protein
VKVVRITGALHGLRFHELKVTDSLLSDVGARYQLKHDSDTRDGLFNELKLTRNLVSL